MTKRALTFFSLPAMFAALSIAAPASAQTTQCQPGDLFCAELRIGPGSAGIRIGGDAPPPPPPPVYVQPPTVYVEPAPPPPPPPPPQVVYQPQPPTVYVQPAPPQPVYVQPVQPMPQQMVVRRVHEDRFPYSSTGIHLHMGGLFGEHTAMGGAGGALRLRPIPHLAIDLGGGVYGGQDYNGLDRVEVPLQADLLFFFNPQHRFQFYALVGVGASFGHADGFNRFTGNFDSRDYAHLGGELGLGVEWRISRVFALNLDVRGFMRQRVDGNPAPEFQEWTSSGTLRSTDTSGGVLGRVGMTFYFAN